MRTRTKVKAGGLAVNHNEIPRSSQPVKTALKPDVLDLPELKFESDVLRRLDNYDCHEFSDPIEDLSCPGTLLPARWSEASILVGEQRLCSM